MIGARRDADQVLTTIVNKNQRYARRDTIDDADMTDVDALAAIDPQCLAAQLIVTDGRDEYDLRAARRAATAWLAPLPPGVVANELPRIV